MGAIWRNGSSCDDCLIGWADRQNREDQPVHEVSGQENGASTRGFEVVARSGSLGQRAVSHIMDGPKNSQRNS